MKRTLITIIASIVFLCCASAQNAIKFLGIPVEGSKSEMIRQLREKGYESVYGDVLAGEFNGTAVNITVQTVSNRVWRIAVIDQGFDNESNIKIRFNNLLRQFSNNRKYDRIGGTELTEKDNIGYEMSVHNKRYEASFRPKDKSINGQVWYMIAERYGKYQIAMFYENLDNAANGDDL